MNGIRWQDMTPEQVTASKIRLAKGAAARARQRGDLATARAQERIARRIELAAVPRTHVTRCQHGSFACTVCDTESS